MFKHFLKKKYTQKTQVYFLIFILPSVVSAQNFFPCNGPDCQFTDLVKVAQEVANFIIKLGLTLSPLIFAYAGFLYLTSGANPGQRSKANGIFKNVVIGLVIMMCAWLFVSLILNALLNATVRSAIPFMN